MTAVSFPALVPSSRSYSPGVFPEQQFQSQNGAVVRVRYGNQRYSSSLSLTFANISDEKLNRFWRTTSLSWATISTSQFTVRQRCQRRFNWLGALDPRNQQPAEVEIRKTAIGYKRQARTVYSDV